MQKLDPDGTNGAVRLEPHRDARACRGQQETGIEPADLAVQGWVPHVERNAGVQGLAGQLAAQARERRSVLPRLGTCHGTIQRTKRDRGRFSAIHGGKKTLSRLKTTKRNGGKKEKKGKASEQTANRTVAGSFADLETKRHQQPTPLKKKKNKIHRKDAGKEKRIGI